MADHTKAHRSEAQLKKMQRAEDGRKAMAEYEAEQAAVLAKTERLRALRLAHEAKLAEAARAAPRKPAVKKTVAKKKAGVAASAKKAAA